MLLLRGSLFVVVLCAAFVAAAWLHTLIRPAWIEAHNIPAVAVPFGLLQTSNATTTAVSTTAKRYVLGSFDVCINGNCVAKADRGGFSRESSCGRRGSSVRAIYVATTVFGAIACIAAAVSILAIGRRAFSANPAGVSAKDTTVMDAEASHEPVALDPAPALQRRATLTPAAREPVGEDEGRQQQRRDRNFSTSSAALFQPYAGATMSMQSGNDDGDDVAPAAGTGTRRGSSRGGGGSNRRDDDGGGEDAAGGGDGPLAPPPRGLFSDAAADDDGGDDVMVVDVPPTAEFGRKYRQHIAARTRAARRRVLRAGAGVFVSAAASLIAMALVFITQETFLHCGESSASVYRSAAAALLLSSGSSGGSGDMTVRRGSSVWLVLAITLVAVLLACPLLVVAAHAAAEAVRGDVALGADDEAMFASAERSAVAREQQRQQQQQQQQRRPSPSPRSEDEAGDGPAARSSSRGRDVHAVEPARSPPLHGLSPTRAAAARDHHRGSNNAGDLTIESPQETESMVE